MSSFFFLFFVFSCYGGADFVGWVSVGVYEEGVTGSKLKLYVGLNGFIFF